MFRRADWHGDGQSKIFDITNIADCTSDYVQQIMQIPLLVKCLGLHRMCIEAMNILMIADVNMLLMLQLSLFDR